MLNGSACVCVPLNTYSGNERNVLPRRLAKGVSAGGSYGRDGWRLQNHRSVFRRFRGAF
jgi:hypothetical protein